MRVHPESKREFPQLPDEVPDTLLHEDQARYNHGQSLARLNERGGLSVMELLANIHRRSLSYGSSTQKDVEELLAIIKKHNLTT